MSDIKKKEKSKGKTSFFRTTLPKDKKPTNVPSAAASVFEVPKPGAANVFKAAAELPKLVVTEGTMPEAGATIVKASEVEVAAGAGKILTAQEQTKQITQNRDLSGVGAGAMLEATALASAQGVPTTGKLTSGQRWGGLGLGGGVALGVGAAFVFGGFGIGAAAIGAAIGVTWIATQMIAGKSFMGALGGIGNFFKTAFSGKAAFGPKTADANLKPEISVAPTNENAKIESEAINQSMRVHDKEEKKAIASSVSKSAKKKTEEEAAMSTIQRIKST